MVVQPIEVAGRQRGLAEDLVPVLDAAVGQVDALQVLVEQLEERVDLVACVGVGGGTPGVQRTGSEIRRVCMGFSGYCSPALMRAQEDGSTAETSS